MFEPPIHWHYAGKLRKLLLDKASDEFSTKLINALHDRQEIKMLLAPVPLTTELAETTKRSFERAGMAIYAMTERQGCEYGLSTTYDPAKADWRLATVFMELDPRNDAAGADRAPATLEPGPVPRRKWWHLRGRWAFLQSATTEARHQSLAAPTPTFVALKRRFRSMGAHVIIVFPPKHAMASPDNLDRSFELVHVLEAIQEGDPAICTLPIPGLDRDELLGLVTTLPSQILDGSSEHELLLEREIERAAISAPEGFLVQALWRALKRGYGPERLSRIEFEQRLASLNPNIAKAHPWGSLFDFWGEILRGLESDREYSRRWLDKIEAHHDGLVSLEEIDDILLYEASIYAVHCEANRHSLSYPVVYHGTRWVQTRIALASVFGGGGSTETPAGSFAWDK